MTPYQATFVNTIIETAKIDRAYANWAIQDFQRIDPYQLKDLKQLVREEVMRLKSLETVMKG